jgi:hypothetical protein
MRGPITQTAEFRRKYPLTMIANPGGGVTPESGDIWENESIRLRAVHDEYHEFVEWIGEGPGSYTGPNEQPYVNISGPVTQTAHFVSAAAFELTMTPDPGGSSEPSSGPQPAGESVQLTATPDPGFAFVGWTGVGNGSYSGPDPFPVVTMNQFLTQRAIFVVNETNYEFTISASDEDPYAQHSEAAGGVRNLYFWATRIPYGMSAFEADYEASFQVFGFTPAADVFNLGTDGNLLLVVGGCPAEQKLLGHWTVMDDGGSLCLEPSASTGLFGALDCHAFAPHLWEEAMVLGFASDGSEPCVVGEPFSAPTAASFMEFDARVDRRSVVASWFAPGRMPASDFVLRRSESMTEDGVVVEGERRETPGGFQIVDTAVNGNTTYFYRLAAGTREQSPWVAVVTPDWAPLATGFAMLAPNPFHDATKISFTIASPSRARVTIYDVQGRLVTTLLHDEVPAGEHEVTWNGRIRGGVAASGVYFVRLEAGSYSGSQKLVRWSGVR